MEEPMEEPAANKISKVETVDTIIGLLWKVDSSIRCGQFILAHRDASNILATLSRIEDPDSDIDELKLYTKHVVVNLQNILTAHSNATKAMEVARRMRKAVLHDLFGPKTEETK
jgi:hypothetical protein